MHVLQDLRYALRMLRKTPGFSAIAIVSLALGIGANTAIFSLVDAVLLRFLPVRAPEQLYLYATNPARPGTSMNNPDYEYMRDHNHSFDGVIAYSGTNPTGMSVQEGKSAGGSELAGKSYVSGNYFQVLGVSPILGRTFGPDDSKIQGAHPIAIISHGLWQRRFGGDPHVLGTKIALDSEPFTIIGVTPASFSGLATGQNPDVYVPIYMRPRGPGKFGWNTRHNWWLSVVGRLKPGVSPPQATADMQVLHDQIELNDPERPERERRAKNLPPADPSASKVFLMPAGQGFSGLKMRLEKPLIVLMFVVALVLLIACANVANLLLARGAARQKEIAIRLAIGAARGRLIRQLLTESVLLSVLGSVCGLIVAYWGVQFLVGMLPASSLPVNLHVSPDLRVLGFTLAAALGTGLLFGVAPALQTTRPELTPSLKEEGASMLRVGRFGMRRALVVLQVSLSLLLLAGAGLFVRSLRNLESLDPGFRRTNVVTLEFDPSRVGYKGQRSRLFYDRVLEQTRRIPGVSSASLAAITPLSGSRWNDNVMMQDYEWKPRERRSIDRNSVSPRYFETMGIQLIAGRDFRDSDNLASVPERGAEPSADDNGPPRVAIVNQSMARRFYAGKNPIGRRFSTGDKYDAQKSWEIIGIVADARYFGLRKDAETMFYVPSWREAGNGANLCIRTARDPAQVTATVRQLVRTADPMVAITTVRTMEQQVGNDLLQERIVATLCGFFGLLAVLLAAVGLYGVIAHGASRRTREIGIRMALGARRSNVLWLVLRDALAMFAVGVAVGIPAALAVTRFVSSLLYEVKEKDPLTMIAATILLASVALAAAYLPARRASKVDPMRALRHE